MHIKQENFHLLGNEVGVFDPEELEEKIVADWIVSELSSDSEWTLEYGLRNNVALFDS